MIGPGTGLGFCYLTSDVEEGDGENDEGEEGEYTVHSSEGGHGDFTVREEVDQVVLDYLREEYRDSEKSKETNTCTRVSTERVISGSGITNIYQAIRSSDKKGLPKTERKINESIDLSEQSEKAAIIAQYSEKGDPACTLTMKTFSRSLAHELGCTICRFLPSGGLYISGGVAAKNPGLIGSRRFWEWVVDRGRLRGIVEGYPVFFVGRCEGVGVLGR